MKTVLVTIFLIPVLLVAQPTKIKEFPIAIDSVLLLKHLYGQYNVCIGKGAGRDLTTNNLCIIIGSDSIAKTICCADMIWHVDDNDSVLNTVPKIKELIMKYEKYYLRTRDTKYNRQVLVEKIIRTMQETEKR